MTEERGWGARAGGGRVAHRRPGGAGRQPDPVSHRSVTRRTPPQPPAALARRSSGPAAERSLAYPRPTAWAPIRPERRRWCSRPPRARRDVPGPRGSLPQPTASARERPSARPGSDPRPPGICRAARQPGTPRLARLQAAKPKPLRQGPWMTAGAAPAAAVPRGMRPTGWRGARRGRRAGRSSGPGMSAGPTVVEWSAEAIEAERASRTVIQGRRGIACRGLPGARLGAAARW